MSKRKLKPSPLRPPGGFEWWTIPFAIVFIPLLIIGMLLLLFGGGIIALIVIIGEWIRSKITGEPLNTFPRYLK